jgi:hypothetical protein
VVGLWSLAPRSTIVQLYHGSQFVLLVGETRVSAQNNQPVASYWQSLLHNAVSSAPRLSEIRTHDFSGDRDWLHRYNCKSKDHPNMITMALLHQRQPLFHKPDNVCHIFASKDSFRGRNKNKNNIYMLNIIVPVFYFSLTIN